MSKWWNVFAYSEQSKKLIFFAKSFHHSYGRCFSVFIIDFELVFAYLVHQVMIRDYKQRHGSRYSRMDQAKFVTGFK